MRLLCAVFATALSELVVSVTIFVLDKVLRSEKAVLLLLLLELAKILSSEVKVDAAVELKGELLPTLIAGRARALKV